MTLIEVGHVGKHLLLSILLLLSFKILSKKLLFLTQRPNVAEGHGVERICKIYAFYVSVSLYVCLRIVDIDYQE